MNSESFSDELRVGLTTLDKTELRQALEALIAPSVREMAQIALSLIKPAMQRKTGAFSYDGIFNEVRPLMPASDLPWMTPKEVDMLVRQTIAAVVDARSIDRCFDSPEDELAFLSKVTDTMKQQGFETAGQALAFLKRREIN